MYKIIGGIVVAALVVFLSYSWGKSQAKVEVQTEIQYQERIVYKEAETRIVYKDRIITRIVEKKPDGTVTETTKEEEHDKQEDTKVVEKDNESSQTNRPTDKRVAPQYSAAVRVRPSLDTERYRELGSYEATAGVRLGELPLFGEVGYSDRTVSVGVRVEW